MMQGYFLLCRALGSMLRSARYSEARVSDRQVRKRRRFHAPVLVWLSRPLMRILDTGVRVLPQREWEDRERQIYQRLRGAPIHVDSDGVVVLPALCGQTLASLLEQRKLEEMVRNKAIELAVVALAEFHRLGFTHGDAMAENVLIDLEAGVARWFDFETVHESSRPMDWRRADDVRALLATCLVRTSPEHRAETVGLILDAYADEAMTGTLTSSFESVWQRPLTYHLAQAPLSLQCFREIAHYVPRPRAAAVQPIVAMRAE